jgi:hypothetical protein
MKKGPILGPFGRKILVVFYSSRDLSKLSNLFQVSFFVFLLRAKESTATEVSVFDSDSKDLTKVIVNRLSFIVDSASTF